MPNTGSSVNTAQTSKRLLVRFAPAISNCSTLSVAYAKCVTTNSDNIKKDSCAKEFQEFRNCVKNVSRFFFAVIKHFNSLKLKK